MGCGVSISVSAPIVSVVGVSVLGWWTLVAISTFVMVDVVGGGYLALQGVDLGHNGCHLLKQ